MKFSIRSKLLIGFALLVLLSSVIQLFTFDITRDNTSSQINTLLLEKSQSAAVQIEEFFNSLTEVNNGLAQEYVEGGYTSSDKLISLIQYAIKNNRHIKQITFLTPTGREIIDVDRFSTTPSDKLSFEIYTEQFTQASKGTSAISKVYFLDNDTGPHVDIFSPITSEKKSIRGVIKMRISLIKLWDIISKVKAGKEGFAYVVDNEGRIIAHPQERLVLDRKNVLELKIVQALISGTEQQLAEEDYQYTNSEKKQVIAKGITIPSSGWVVLFEQPVDEAFSVLEFLRSLFLLTLIGSIVFLLIISLLVSESIIRPIRKLQQFAQILESGRLDTRVSVASGDEIEELSSAFNIMISRLQNSFATSELHKQKAEKAAQLLLGRDLDLRRINDELEEEKTEISAEKNKLSVILSGITDAVIAVDFNRKIITLNPAAERLLGQPGSTIVGKSISVVLKFFDKNDEITVDNYCPIKVDEYEGIVWSKSEIRLESNTGKRSFVNIASGQIKEGARVNLGCILTLHDVTSEKQLEEMKLDFVSMAAHELRTPLTAIRGYASLLREELTESLNKDAREYVNRLIISSDNLGVLIDNLLNVSRIERNTFKVEAYPIDITKTLETTSNNFEEQAHTKQQTLTFHRPIEALPKVLADEFRISQVLSNLIANAISYTKEHGQIDIYVGKKDGFVEVSIKDTGEGIPQEALPKLFTKFFRVSGALEQGSKGTGLGLFITKSIIAMHKGTIWVESEEGRGSTFHFTLPLATEQDVVEYQKRTDNQSLTGRNMKGIIMNNELISRRLQKTLDEIRS